MTNEETILKLTEMRLTAMASAFRERLACHGQPQLRGSSGAPD